VLRAADGIYGLQASLLKTMASPRRLELIHFLSETGPIEVRRLAEHFGLPQPAISQHLAALRAAGLSRPFETAAKSATGWRIRRSWPPAP
jgi:predicted transcriptional regulator